MNVIWKRPDGFHGARPGDYIVVELQTNSSRIWLHKTDKSNFPFRVSGGWQDEAATKKLNELVNLLNCEKNKWLEYFNDNFHDSKFEDGKSYLTDLEQWINSLKENLKGDKWEIAVMNDTLEDLKLKMSQYKQSFLDALEVN